LPPNLLVSSFEERTLPYPAVGAVEEGEPSGLSAIPTNTGSAL
jgi:hypothetical protein